MAIAKTRTVQRCEVYPAEGNEQPKIMVTYIYTFDDPDDDILPISSRENIILQSTDDVSNEEQIVRDIASAVWS